MGPTNIALVKLFQADQKLREAQGRLDAATRNVRIHERKTREISEKLSELQKKAREQQTKYGQTDLDIKTRDAHIEKLRQQQQTANTSREYQTFLVEINTAKVDKAKIEDEAIKQMEELEKSQAEIKELTTQLESSQSQLDEMRNQIGDKVKSLETEIESLRPAREAAKQQVPPRGLDAFERMADRFEGEALSALAKPNPREEEYVCTSCNMSLVVDVYNRLHTRDELVFCPSCHRILYIPEDLTPERAVHKPKEKKMTRPRKSSSKGAKAPRQQSAVDVMRSVDADPDEQGETEPTEPSQTGPQGEQNQ